jgi:hypothetical protein
MQDTRSINVSSPVVRMNLNDDPLLVKEGETSFVLNGVVGNSYYRNAKGNRKNTTLPGGFFLIGEAPINSTSKVVFSVKTSTGEGQIGIFKDKTYTVKYTSTLFNFKINKQIQAKAKISYKGEIIVYFTDDYNPMRRIDLSNIPQILGDLDTDSINVFQNYDIPNIQIRPITNNGSLLSGSYFIIAQYADANGNALTAWFTPVGSIPIVKDSTSDSFDYVEGIKSNQPTDKAIPVIFSGLDVSFTYLNVGFIKLAEGVHRPFRVATIPTAQGQYIFNGAGNTPTELTMEEITKPVVSYKTAKTLEIVDDLLLWGKLTTKKINNLQSYFNQVQVQWQVERQLATDNQTNYVNPLSSCYRRVFRFGEAYALGVVLRYKDGSKSQVFIISGRKINKTTAGATIMQTTDQYGNAITSGHWDSYSGLGGSDTVDLTGQQRWKIFNTAYIVGNDLSGVTGPAEYGEMGFYQSSDLYPIDSRVWGTKAGEAIRLHKMPDQSIIFLHDGLNGTRVEEEPVYINYLGIRFPNIEEVMAALPTDVKKDVQGWEIVVGDRTYNKSVIASGLLFNTLTTNWKSEEFGPNDIRVYPNYPLNDLRRDPYHFKTDFPGSAAGSPNAGNTSGSGYEAYNFSAPFNDRYRQDVFTFLSPDTFFKKSMLSIGELHIHGEIYGTSRQDYKYVSPYPLLFDKSSSDDDNVTLQMTAVGWYNNYKKPFYGNLRRKVSDALYAPFNTQIASGNIGIPMHNTMRESSVLIGVTANINDPITTDTSRIYPLDSDVACNRNAVPRRPCSCHYASFIRRIDNQYGGVFNIKYNTTNYTNFNVANNTIVFAGDTFVGRFTAKRQMVFFKNAQSFMDAPNGSKPDFKNTSNISKPIWVYDGSGSNSRTNSRTMCGTDQELGQIPLIYSGVPVFYTEADDNITLRLNGDLIYETFYKNLQNGAILLNEWLGIKNIDKDNYNIINPDYSTLNNVSYYDNGSPFYDPDTDAGLEFYGRTIYSLSSSPEDIFDNWQIYLPRNYYDFPKNEGAIIDIKSIGNYRTLFRLENGLFMDQLYTVIATDSDGINLGDGKLFNKKPLKLVTTDNQYSGTRSQWCFNNTPFGAFTADIERGVVFHISEGIRDVNNDPQNPTMCDKWFIENLPLKLTKHIPGFFNIDNPANENGIGLLSIYDSENKIWILTKRDYELAHPENAGNYIAEADGTITCTSTLVIVDGLQTFVSATVSLSDPTHFVNKSFSIGYSILHQGWVSFYSFIPNYFMTIGNMMYSGLNQLSKEFIYSHDSPSNHVYYETVYKHVIELVIKNDSFNSFSNLWYSFITKAFKDFGDGRLAEVKYATFNKAIVYNSIQCSGNLELIVQDENDLSTLFTTLAPTTTSRKLGLRKTDAEFNFSQVYDLSDSVNGAEGFFTKKWSLLQSEYFIDKILDNTLLDYTRDYSEEASITEIYTKMRLILDNRNDVVLTTYLSGKTSKASNK